MSWREQVRAASARRISSSSLDDRGTVRQGPARLLEAARASVSDPSLSLEEYTAARLASSEYSSASPEVWAAVVDAELNRAARRGRTLFGHLCPEGTFGRQGRGSPARPAATARDPSVAALVAARAVLRGPARGIAQGAERFFDPRVMDAMHRREPWRVSCDALGLLRRWAYDHPRGADGRKCPGDRTRIGSSPEAWVGPIPGIDPYELMLMRPTPISEYHTDAYRAAVAAIERGRSGLGPMLVAAVDNPLTLALLAAAGLLWSA